MKIIYKDIMVKGTHNSFTGFPLAGKQKYFSWLIQPFSKCQRYKTLSAMICDNVQYFDIQVARRNCLWYVSHGIAWYDAPDLYTILRYLNNIDNEYMIPIYVSIGLDNHFLQDEKDKEKQRIDFENYINAFGDNWPNLSLVRAYIEKPWTILYEDRCLVFEKYWSLSWAKTMKKHWWQFYYYLPIPRLWKRIYGKKWDKEAEESGKKIYITDFV